MSGDFDPRDLGSLGLHDGVRDREDEWLTLGAGPGMRIGPDHVCEGDDDWREDPRSFKSARLRSGFQ